MECRKLLLLLKVCNTSQSLTHAKLLHQRIILCGLQDDARIWRRLFHLYFSSRSYHAAATILQVAAKFFDIIPWNALVSAYCKNDTQGRALQLFRKLLENPFIEPDIFSYPSAVKACGALGMAKIGSSLHGRLVKINLMADTVIASSISGMYGNCNLFTECEHVFDEIPQKDVACWNEVISSFYHRGRPEQVLIMFEKMKSSGFVPSSSTLTTAICACARLADVKKGMEIHQNLVENGILLDDYITSALVDLYAKCGFMGKSRDVFELMPFKFIAAWNSVMSGHCHERNYGECIKLFRRMISEGNTPNLTTLCIVLSACSRLSELQTGKVVHGYIVRTTVEVDAFINNVLIDLYFRCGKVCSAENVFKSLKKSDVACWNVMIHGYVQVGNYSKSLNTYYRMVAAGVKPDAITYSSALSACSKSESFNKGMEIHKSVVENGMENNEVIMGALLEMYGKCGAVEQAYSIFVKLPKTDLLSWTNMIAVYGYNGQAEKALSLFHELQRSEIRPDEQTFLAVLTSCSIGGLIDEGRLYFSEMSKNYGIDPRFEHVSCLVHMLARAGRIPELFEIFPDSLDMKAGSKTEVSKLLEENVLMEKRGLRKIPGCSWVEIPDPIQIVSSG